jgi:hypothetical protein
MRRFISNPMNIYATAVFVIVVGLVVYAAGLELIVRDPFLFLGILANLALIGIVCALVWLLLELAWQWGRRKLGYGP